MNSVLPLRVTSSVGEHDTSFPKDLTEGSDFALFCEGENHGGVCVARENPQSSINI